MLTKSMSYHIKQEVLDHALEILYGHWKKFDELRKAAWQPKQEVTAHVTGTIDFVFDKGTQREMTIQGFFNREGRVVFLDFETRSPFSLPGA